MGNWIVYGEATFSMEVPESKSEADARIAVLSRLMDLEGVKLEVTELDAKISE